MSDFPTGVYSPRTKANRPGVTYDPDNQYAGYAEDVTKLDDEIVAIEQFLRAAHYKIVGSAAAHYITDGTADEVQINQAITDLAAVGGGILHLRGEAFNAAANIVHKSGVTVEGEGDATVVNFPVNNTYWNLDGLTGCKIRDLKIDNTSQSGSTYYKCIGIVGCSRVTVENCYLHTMAFGIFAWSTATQLTEKISYKGNTILGNCINDLIGGGPVDDSSLDCRDFNIQGNYIIQDKNEANSGTYYNAFDMVAAKEVKFKNNICWGAVEFGWERDPHEYSEISGNTIQRPLNYPGAPSSALLIVSDESNTGDVSSSILVAGNTIVDGWIYIIGKSGQPMRNVHVNDNIIKILTMVGSGGIKFTYCDYSQMHGNQCSGISGSTQPCLVLDNSNHCQVNDNYVDGWDVALQSSGTSTYNQWSDNYIINFITAAVGSAVLSATGASLKNNYGINPDSLLNDAGNITGAVTFDRSTGSEIKGVLTGNITVTMPVTRVPRGERIVLRLVQDATGSRTVTWPSNFKKVGGTLTLSTAANAVDVIEAECDGTNWNEVGRSLALS